MKKFIITPAIIFIFSPFVRAKKSKFQDDHDTSYYSVYRSMLTGRAYLSRKYNILSFNPPPPA